MKPKTINIVLVIIIILLIIVPSCMYVISSHNDSLWLVVNKEVVEAANKCKNENKCLDNSVTLKYLIDNNYIDKVYDPVTKEIISDNSYVDFSTNEFKVVS